MNVMVSLSATPMAHPPRSNPFLRSSSDAPPFPCITPSTVTCVMVVSFTGSSFLSWWSSRYDRNEVRISSVERGSVLQGHAALRVVDRHRSSPQPAHKLRARRNAQLPEGLPQVVLDSAGADAPAKIVRRSASAL